MHSNKCNLTVLARATSSVSDFEWAEICKKLSDNSKITDENAQFLSSETKWALQKAEIKMLILKCWF